jgi:hypothetical protein
MITRPFMLGDDTAVLTRILDRHLVTGKFDHPRALGTVPRIQRQYLLFGHIVWMGFGSIDFGLFGGHS